MNHGLKVAIVSAFLCYKLLSQRKHHLVDSQDFEVDNSAHRLVEKDGGK